MIAHDLWITFFELAWLRVAVFIALASLCYELYSKFIAPVLYAELSADADVLKNCTKKLDVAKSRLTIAEEQTFVAEQKIAKLRNTLEAWQKQLKVAQEAQQFEFKRQLELQQHKFALTQKAVAEKVLMRKEADRAIVSIKSAIKTQRWPDLLATLLDKWQHNE